MNLSMVVVIGGNNIMEAPEKIYLIRNIPTSTALNTTNDCHEKYLQEWYKCREKDADVEYIRADAFIEKACDYLMDYEFNDSPTIADRRKRVDEFRNYMKGE